MDIIADAEDYTNSGRPRDNNIANSESDSQDVESESSDYDVDAQGNKIKRQYVSEEQRRFEK